MKRDLRPFPLAEAMKALLGGTSGARIITMGCQQWDATLSAAYAQGWILLELDERRETGARVPEGGGMTRHALRSPGSGSTVALILVPGPRLNLELGPSTCR